MVGFPSRMPDTYINGLIYSSQNPVDEAPQDGSPELRRGLHGGGWLVWSTLRMSICGAAKLKDCAEEVHRGAAGSERHSPLGCLGYPALRQDGHYTLTWTLPAPGGGHDCGGSSFLR